jgi:hypothetical protein
MSRGRGAPRGMQVHALPLHVPRAGRESGSGRAGCGARADGSEFEGRAGRVGGGRRVHTCDWAGSAISLANRMNMKCVINKWVLNIHVVPEE